MSDAQTQAPNAGAAIPPLRSDAYEAGFVVLSAIFISALIATNLIFQKYFAFDVGGYEVAQSVGLLAYPVTFLVTDVLSEIYGKRRTNMVVTAGFFASLFVVLLVEVADSVPSASFGIGSETFSHVFGISKVAIFASMCAYLTAQFIDVRVFHWMKRKTKGKHLWLRNNFSTFTSQFVDTVVVLCLLAGLGGEEIGITWDIVPRLIVNGILFKWAFAAIDTPLFYLAVGAFKRRFPNEIAQLDRLELAEWSGWQTPAEDGPA